MYSYWVKACGSPECQVTHDRFSDTVQYSTCTSYWVNLMTRCFWPNCVDCGPYTVRQGLFTGLFQQNYSWANQLTKTNYPRRLSVSDVLDLNECQVTAPVWLYWVGTSLQQPSTLWSTQNTTHTVWTVIWSYRKRIKCVALCCKHSVPLHTLPKHTNTYTHWQLDTNNLCVCTHAHHAATVHSFRSILTHI